MVITTELLLLYFSTELCFILLARTSKRFNTLPPFRQRQISIIPPIIAFKTCIIYFFLSSGSLIAQDLNAASLDQLFKIVNHICFGYIFEILYRPSPRLLQGHHIALQALTFYFTLYLRHQSHYALLARLCSVVIVFGVGLTDSFVDLMVFAYRICSLEKDSSKFLVRVLARGSEIARGVQWIVLWGFILLNLESFAKLLYTWEKFIWVLALAGWVWTEIDDVVKLNAMARNFGRRGDTSVN
jgi:hypothetical protein